MPREYVTDCITMSHQWNINAFTKKRNFRWELSYYSKLAFNQRVSSLMAYSYFISRERRCSISIFMACIVMIWAHANDNNTRFHAINDFSEAFAARRWHDCSPAKCSHITTSEKLLPISLKHDVVYAHDGVSEAEGINAMSAARCRELSRKEHFAVGV